MLLRLLLALLVASFALPAAAAAPVCHEETRMVGMHHDAPAPVEKTAAHVCVGCAPLADWAAARVGELVVPSAPTEATPARRLDLGGAVAPALPPPRRA